MAIIPVGTCLWWVNQYTYTDADVTQLKCTVLRLHVRFCSPTQFHSVHLVQEYNGAMYQALTHLSTWAKGHQLMRVCGGEPGYEARGHVHVGGERGVIQPKQTELEYIYEPLVALHSLWCACQVCCAVGVGPMLWAPAEHVCASVRYYEVKGLFSVGTRLALPNVVLANKELCFVHWFLSCIQSASE